MKIEPRKELSYEEKAKKLRAFGFNVHLYAKKKHTPQLKAATTRLFKKHAVFLNPKPGTSPVKFFATSKAERRLAKTVLSSRSLTPGGFFLQVPKGVSPRSYKVSVDLKRKRVCEQIKGRQCDEIIPLRSRDVATDPSGAFRKSISRATKKGRKPKQAQLIVNGFQGKRVQSLKSMLYYLENSPRFSSETEDMDDDDFEDTFQIKLIYGSQSKKKKARTKKVRRRRR